MILTAEPKTYKDPESGEEIELPKEPLDLGYVRQLHGMGKTYREIAEKLGTTENYIKKRMYEDRKKKEEQAANKRKRGRPPGSKNKRTEAEKTMLTNWQNSPMSPAMREDKAELNRMAGWFVTECLKQGQQTDKDSIESLYASLQKYIELCTKTGMPMLVKTCNLALGVTGVTMTKWKNGTQRANDPRYKQFAELCEAVVGAGIEAAAAAGSVDRILTIWWQKAYFNMTESDGKAVENDDPLGEKKSASEITQKYADILPEDN